MKTEKSKIFGKELVLDLYDCDLKIISSKEKIKEFSDELCRRIKMKKYGETIIEKFGFGKDYTAGYSIGSVNRNKFYYCSFFREMETSLFKYLFLR